jgi:hypothetical protein
MQKVSCFYVLYDIFDWWFALRLSVSIVWLESNKLGQATQPFLVTLHIACSITSTGQGQKRSRCRTNHGGTAISMDRPIGLIALRLRDTVSRDDQLPAALWYHHT